MILERRFFRGAILYVCFFMTSKPINVYFSYYFKKNVDDSCFL